MEHIPNASFAPRNCFQNSYRMALSQHCLVGLVYKSKPANVCIVTVFQNLSVKRARDTQRKEVSLRCSDFQICLH